jgi:transcriptional regulator with XRE-family HTH domain
MLFSVNTEKSLDMNGNMNEKVVLELLGKNVKRLRARNKWSQETLAEKIDVSANFLSNIETGKAWVSPKTVARLTDAFKVATHELFMPIVIAGLESNETLIRYNREVRELINLALDEVEKRYID